MGYIAIYKSIDYGKTTAVSILFGPMQEDVRTIQLDDDHERERTRSAALLRLSQIQRRPIAVRIVFSTLEGRPSPDIIPVCERQVWPSVLSRIGIHKLENILFCFKCSSLRKLDDFTVVLKFGLFAKKPQPLITIMFPFFVVTNCLRCSHYVNKQ